MMTPWFDKYTRPHWVGVYETRVHHGDDSTSFNYWNGASWEKTTINPERAKGCFLFNSNVQHIEWRGFTKEQT